MRRFLAAAVVVLGLCGMAQAQTLSPNEFTQTLARDLNAAVPSANVTVGAELSLQFRHAGKTGVLGLSDLYVRYRAEPDIYPRIVASMTDQLIQMTPPGQAVREDIIPFIRTRTWLAELQKSHGARKPKDVAIYEPLNKDLIVVYTESNERGTRILGAIEKLPVAREDLKALAFANLERRLANPKLFKIVPEVDVYGFVSDNPHGSSLLLLDSFWTSGKIKVKGDIVVSIPVRKAVMIAGSHDSVALDTLRVAAGKFVEDGLEVQTDMLFVRRNGKWARFSRKKAKEQDD
jgi:uncharacterized protein YtpQ (UPF0354 family)